MDLRRAAFIFSSLVLGAVLPPASLQGQIAQGQELITLPGRDTIHDLTLNTQVATSVTFPADITLVIGYGLVLDAAAAQGLMDAEAVAAATLKDLAPQPVTIVHYALAARDTLVMRAIRRGTPCYLTVRCGEQIYLFKVSAGDRANVAVLVTDAIGSGTAVEVAKEDIVKSRTNYNSTELIGILSRAKQRDFLESVNPALYEGWHERRGISLSSENGGLVSTITEIQQWPQKDALVFRTKIENKGAHRLRFNPSDVKVRAGDASYTAQLADSSGVVEPGRVTLLDLVVQGNSSGGKEHLSISNDFRLEVAVATQPPPPPNDLLPPPNPLLPALEKGGMALPLPEVSAPSKDEIRLPLPNFYGGK
ncbi:hypothetical protein DES53_101949 [Roseimicrobium gellanilyticum]|uniref:Uncharacterized protein n=1 Tax=Roseimicrobium gellanilyticum TaxID=748857 RepID=A0A366HWT1_9BACT|nr:hypothetical protein [Roseimicrobium gellanilyticum]RBP48149.1 hypothetical protein DES53_101949 [Roseimicrobium gellanilyticum]